MQQQNYAQRIKFIPIAKLMPNEASLAEDSKVFSLNILDGEKDLRILFTALNTAY